MIDIDRRHPWLFWPNSICPSFSDKPAADILKGDQYYKVTFDFLYTEGHKKDLFAIVPNYTGFSTVDNRVFLGMGCEGGDDWFAVDYYLEPQKRYKLTLEHKPKESLEVFINNESIYKTDRHLEVMDNPQMFIGAGYWPDKDEPNRVDFTIFDIKIENKTELLAHHTFDNIIHSKSVDKTGNNNFIYQLR